MGESLDKNIIFNSKKFEKEKEYWNNILKESELNSTFSFYDENTNEANNVMEYFEYNFEKVICDKLLQISNNSDEILLNIFIAMTSTLMYKYFAQSKCLVTTTILKQHFKENLLNYVLPIKTVVNNSMTVKEILIKTREQYIEAYENFNFPIDLIEKNFYGNDSDTTNSILKTFVILDNIQDEKYIKTINPNIIFLFHIDNEKISLRIKYTSSVYEKDNIKIIANNFNQLLESSINNIDCTIEKVDILSEDEKEVLINKFNNTKVVYDDTKLIHQLFEEQVDKTPNNVALIYEKNKITYKELNEKANSIARTLKDYGIKDGDLVGIILNRSFEMISAILGVLKSGAAYIPIDPQYPSDRIKYMLENSNSKLIISTKRLLDSSDVKANILDIYDTKSLNKDNSNLGIINKSSDLAYVIYTSGTTGKPKGVMVEHKQVTNYIAGINKETSISSCSTMLCITTICFDIFATEVLVPLVYGLKVIIANNDEQIDGDILSKIILENNIDVIQMTPSRIEMMMQSEKFQNSVKNLKVLILGGESLQKNLSEKLISKINASIYNVYGPTETTVWSTIKLLNRNDEKVTIGRPLQNTKIYIMNNNNELLPIGIVGELCVSGAGVSRGYLNNEDLTKKKYIYSPFNKDEIIYKTGDLAKLNSSGDIEILGRIDKQVKIRGFRIELGEIEKVLMECKDVKNAIVLVRNSTKSLCAYIVCSGEINIELMREYLKKKLPEYMIPSQYMKIDKVPITVNGKIDKQKLMDLRLDNPNRIKIAPRSFQETIISDIWKEILQLEEVYIYDDFFELGGNSISIVQVSKQIESKLGVVINPSEIIANSKLNDLAQLILENSNDDMIKYKHIFKINKSTSKDKIFLFHGGDSDIYYYRYLAKLLEDRYSVYGIQPKGLDGRDSLPVSYYEMLCDYIKEIKSIQPKGPYILGGYCVGGYCSYDTTKILELQKEKVTLIQIDQEPFVNRRYLKGAKKREPVLRAIELWRRISRKNYIYTFEKYRKIYEKPHIISKEHQLEIISSRKNIFTYFTKELLHGCNYTPCAVSIKSPTIVIKAVDNHCDEFEIASWDDMAKGKLEFYEIPGGHLDMVLPPYVDKVAELILQFLDKIKW